MPTCSVRWRPSGGRGEFEFIPADSLRDREIILDLSPMDIRMRAEVRGVYAQGKPRLRKFESNNRLKLHLPQLVMAIAALPDPARSTDHDAVEFPLENKTFVINEMVFDIIDDDGSTSVLRPLRVSIRDTDFTVDLAARLTSIAKDVGSIDTIGEHNGALADAVAAHSAQLRIRGNSIALRSTADAVLSTKSNLFGPSNFGSAMTLIDVQQKPEVRLEKMAGVEGRLLTRTHVYRERDHTFAKHVRAHYTALAGGPVRCHACGNVPTDAYGPAGDSCLELHHKTPIAQLQPDSVTVVDDMALVCANCHRVIHSKTPCFTMDEIVDLVASS